MSSINIRCLSVLIALVLSFDVAPAAPFSVGEQNAPIREPRFGEQKLPDEAQRAADIIERRYHFVDSEKGGHQLFSFELVDVRYPDGKLEIYMRGKDFTKAKLLKTLYVPENGWAKRLTFAGRHSFPTWTDTALENSTAVLTYSNSDNRIVEPLRIELEGLRKSGPAGPKIKSYDYETVGRDTVEMGGGFQGSQKTKVDAAMAAKYDQWVLFDADRALSEKEKDVVDNAVAALIENPASSVAILSEVGVDDEVITNEIIKKLPKDFRVFVVPSAALADTNGLQGVLEQNIKLVQAQAAREPTIFVFPDLHTYAGAGTAQGNSNDVLDRLQSDIKAGRFRILGQTSPDGFQESVTPTVRSLFETYTVESPARPQVIEKLRHYIQSMNVQTMPSEAYLTEVIEAAENFDIALEDPGRSLRLMKFVIRRLRQSNEAGFTQDILDEAVTKAYGLDPDIIDSKKQLAKAAQVIEVLDQGIIGLENVKQAFVELYKKKLMGFYEGSGAGFSMLLAGPPGTGKTEFGKVASKATGYASVKLDMAQYTDQSGSEDLIAEIATHLMKNPFTIFTLDEVEKVNAETQNKLLNLLNDKYFTARVEGKGGKKKNVRLSARHAIFLMTTNAAEETVQNWFEGNRQLNPPRGSQWNDDELRAAILKSKLSTRFGSSEFSRPFLDRITSVLPVYPASRENFGRIVKLMMNGVLKEAKASCRCEIEVSNLDEFVGFIVTEKFPARGVAKKRSSNREIKRLISEFLGNALTSSYIGRGQAIEITLKDPFKAPADVDVWKDEEFRKSVIGLEAAIKNEIFGQNEAIQTTVNAIHGYAARGRDVKNPLFLYFIGSTGTGKTEMGRAVAKALNVEFQLVDMSEISDTNSYQLVMGKDRTFDPNAEPGPFEQVLMNTRRGGVIVLDEFSNMGSNQPAMFNALVKRFYKAADEGLWTSPTTGETYDIRNRIFMLTGNDGDQLFAGTSAEDLRIATWQEVNEPSIKKQLLIERGMPEPFYERLMDVVFFKPLAAQEMIKMTHKFLAPSIESFRRKGIEINLSESFMFDFIRGFFASSSGGRGLRKIVEIRLAGFFSQAITAFRDRYPDSEGLTLSLQLTDNFVNKPYIDGKEPARQVLLKIDIRDSQSRTETMTYDMTAWAQKRNRFTRKQALLTAYHEAGHAVTNNSSITGETLQFLTIVGADNYLGYARYRRLPQAHGQNPTEDAVIYQMAKYYAGSLAQQMGGFSRDAGWREDLKQMRKLGSAYLLEYGFGTQFLGVKLDKDDNPILSGEDLKLFREELNLLMKQAEDVGRQAVAENWDLIRATALKLMQTGSITGSEFAELQRTTTATDAWIIDGNNQVKRAPRSQKSEQSPLCRDLFAE